MHFSKNQILFQKSDSTIGRQILSSWKCKSDQNEDKTDAKKILKQSQKGVNQATFCANDRQYVNTF